jgi:hypothetical protein
MLLRTIPGSFSIARYYGAEIIASDALGAFRIRAADGVTLTPYEGARANIISSAYSADGLRIGTLGSDALRIWTTEGAPLGKGPGATLGVLAPDLSKVAIATQTDIFVYCTP